MSVAPALSTGLLASPAPARGSDARPADDGGAFRDTLDKASRSREPEASEQPADVSDRSSRESDFDAVAQAEGRREDAELPRAESAAADFTLLLATLKGTSASATEVSTAEAGAAGAAEAVAAPASQPAGTASEDTLELPGMLDDGEVAAEVGLLIETEAGAEAPAETGPVKVMVVRQETHLALEPVRTDVMARLGGEGEDGGAPDALPAAKPAQPVAEMPAGGAAAETVEGLAADRRGAAQVQESRSQASGSGAGRASPDGGGFEPSAIGGGSAAQGSGAQHGQAQNGQSQGQGQGSSAVFAALAGIGGPTAAAPDAGEDFTGFTSPSEQIAAEVRAELTAGGLGESSSDGMVKVLHLELKPANLGSVTVRIALKDNTVTLHLETQRRETLAAIEREKDALAAVLGSAGYKVEGISAAPQSEGSRSGTTFAGAATGGAGDMGQQAAGQGLADSSSGQREGQPSSGNSAYRSPADGNDDGTGGTRRATGALYV